MTDYTIVQSNIDAALSAVVVHTRECQSFLEDEYYMDFGPDHTALIPSSCEQDFMHDTGLAGYTSAVR